MLASNIPTTLSSARIFLSINCDSFVRYVFCPVCTKLYKLDHILFNSGQVKAKTCYHVKFARFRRAAVCGAKLVREVVLKNGSRKFYPIKTYCYNSITEDRANLLKRAGLEKMCEKWQYREINRDYNGDVYDGQVWKIFDNSKGTKPFLDIRDHMVSC